MADQNSRKTKINALPDRRQFLKASAVAASTVFAAPAIGRAGISANEKMGVAVVGVNGRGGSHISA
ncbi:MAG: twin-arginine translocation signal domain-containing protein [Planctomyces sp.]